MDNQPQQYVPPETVKKPETVHVTFRRSEVIELLKLLEGFKRKIQTLLTPDK